MAEVISPSENFSDVEAKVQNWLEAGVRVVLAVDPQNSTVFEYRSPSQIHAHSSGSVDLDDVLAGFQLDVAELFA